MDVVDKTVRDIKSLKIQGAEHVAEAAVVAWMKAKNKKEATKKLAFARPTEPMLRNILYYLSKGHDPKKLLVKIREDKKRIMQIGAEKIRNDMIVFTHCHSSTVISILKEAKNQGKNFEVHFTETRPWHQGWLTARDLSKAKIKGFMYVDAGARLALKKADIVLFGADAITTEGSVINKIGSELFAEIAEKRGTPVYCCTHSLKFDPKTYFGFEESFEKVSGKDIWKKAPKGIEINTYIFEKINSNLISGIVCEFGIVPPASFVEEMKRNYGWLFA